MANYVTFPNGLSVNDGPYDAVGNPGGLTNGGSRANLVPAMAANVDTYNRTVTAQVAAAASAASASASALGPTTSTTSLAISIGTKTATLAAPLSIANGAMLRFTDAANTANYFTMKVTSGGGTTSVTGDVATIGGSGTKSSWLVQVTGADGVPITGYIGQGLHTISVLASGMVPRTTNGPALYRAETTTNKVMIVGLAFDASTAEYAQVVMPMAKSWNASTITVQFGWMVPSGSGNVVWAARATSMSDDDPFDTAFGTAVTVTDGVTATGDLMISAVSSALTIGNSPAKSDQVIVEVYRDAANGSDTLAADAVLMWVKIFLSFDAQTDA